MKHYHERTIIALPRSPFKALCIASHSWLSNIHGFSYHPWMAPVVDEDYHPSMSANLSLEGQIHGWQASSMDLSIPFMD